MTADRAPVVRGTPLVAWERRITRTQHRDAACCLAGECAAPYRPVYLAVVLVLATYADHATGRNAHPGRERVVKVVGCSDATTTRAYAWGVEHGWLDRRGRAGGAGVAAVYTLTLPLAAPPVVIGGEL